MQNTVQQTGDIQQGTQPGELADKIAGQRIVKQNFAHPVTENQKQNRKNKAKKQSVQDCFFIARAICAWLCALWASRQPEVKDGKGIGQYTGKQNDGHGHTGQDTKNTQGI